MEIYNYMVVIVISKFYLHTGRSLTDIPDAVLIKFDLLMMSTEVLETCRGL